MKTMAEVRAFIRELSHTVGVPAPRLRYRDQRERNNALAVYWFNEITIYHLPVTKKVVAHEFTHYLHDLSQKLDDFLEMDATIMGTFLAERVRAPRRKK